MNKLARAGIDLVTNKVNTEFAEGSREDNMTAFYEQLKEINGGSEFNHSSILNGRHTGLFAIIETF